MLAVAVIVSAGLGIGGSYLLFGRNGAQSSQGGSSGGGKLPQTGMLWWPVPLLAVAGVALFLAGWIRHGRGET